MKNYIGLNNCALHFLGSDKIKNLDVKINMKSRMSEYVFEMLDEKSNIYQTYKAKETIQNKELSITHLKVFVVNENNRCKSIGYWFSWMIDPCAILDKKNGRYYI